MKKIFIGLIIVICLTIPFSNALALDLMVTDYVQVLADCEVIDNSLNEWINNAFKFVQYAGIGLAVVLSTMDFVQVIGGSKDDDLKNAFNRTMKRLIAVILLLITTTLISFIIDISNVARGDNPEIPNCVEGI